MPGECRAESFDGRTVVVTGAASGIGAAVVAEFAARGARTAVVDIKRADAEAVAQELGPQHYGVRCDVADPASVRMVTADILDRFGHVDVLVNSAGVVRLAPAESLSVEDWDVTLAVNLRGTFLMCQEVGRAMVARGSGRIVNLASQAARVALDEHVAYCASKAGVVGLTRVLAAEWGQYGVTVNAISPTVVLTELGRAAWSGPKGDAMRDLIPVGRFAETTEIARAAVFLASDDAGMITGHDLVVDGGYTVR